MLEQQNLYYKKQKQYNDSLNDRVRIYGEPDVYYQQSNQKRNGGAGPPPYNASAHSRNTKLVKSSIDDIAPEKIEGMIPSFGLPFIERQYRGDPDSFDKMNA